MSASNATDPFLAAIQQGVEVVDLGRQLFNGMPQSANHPQYRLVLERRHGDVYRSDGASGANEIIIMSGHLGTHIDAFAHAAYNDLLHDDVPAIEASRGGRFKQYGAETIPTIVGRGVFLDVPAALGLEYCEGGYEITVAELEAVVQRAGVTLQRGDTVLIRTGWGRFWGDRPTYEGTPDGTPGPGADAARWLAGFEPIAVGGDTIAFERLGGPGSDLRLPAHTILLVERGIYIIEMLELDGLAAVGAAEFMFVLSPLGFVGGTAAPTRPLAILGKQGA